MTVKISGLMQVHHVASILACTRQHVRNLIRRGELQAVMIGGNGRRKRYGIVRASVLNFMEKNKIEAEDFFQ